MYNISIFLIIKNLNISKQIIEILKKRKNKTLYRFHFTFLLIFLFNASCIILIPFFILPFFLQFVHNFTFTPFIWSNVKYKKNLRHKGNKPCKSVPRTVVEVRGAIAQFTSFRVYARRIDLKIDWVVYKLTKTPTGKYY